MVAGHLLFGMLDVFALIALTLKTYRYPLLQQLYKILLFCIFISIFSYVMRIFLQIPKMDLPVQYLFIVLFFALLLRIRILHAAFIVGAGLGAFLFIQALIYHIFFGVGLVDPTILTANMDSRMFLLQASSQLVVGLMAYYMYLFKYGFIFIDVKTSLDDQDPIDTPMFLVILISCITASVTVVMLYNANPLGVAVLTAINYGTSYYLSKRRDYDDIKASVEAYRNRNKTE